MRAFFQRAVNQQRFHRSFRSLRHTRTSTGTLTNILGQPWNTHQLIQKINVYVTQGGRHDPRLEPVLEQVARDILQSDVDSLGADNLRRLAILLRKFSVPKQHKLQLAFRHVVLRTQDLDELTFVTVLLAFSGARGGMVNDPSYNHLCRLGIPLVSKMSSENVCHSFSILDNRDLHQDVAFPLLSALSKRARVDIEKYDVYAIENLLNCVRDHDPTLVRAALVQLQKVSRKCVVDHLHYIIFLLQELDLNSLPEVELHAFLSTACRLLHPRLNDYTAAVNSGILFNIAKLDYYNKDFVDAVTVQCMERMSQLTRKDAAKVLWACMALQHYNVQLVCQLSALISDAPTFHDGEIVMMLQALHGLDHYEQHVVDAVVKLMLDNPNNLRQLNGYNISVILKTLADFDHRDDRLMDALKDCLDKLPNHQLGNSPKQNIQLGNSPKQDILNALLHFDYLDDALCQKLTNMTLSAVKAHISETGELSI